MQDRASLPQCGCCASAGASLGLRLLYSHEDGVKSLAPAGSQAKRSKRINHFALCPRFRVCVLLSKDPAGPCCDPRQTRFHSRGRGSESLHISLVAIGILVGMGAAYRQSTRVVSQISEPEVLPLRRPTSCPFLAYGLTSCPSSSLAPAFCACGCGPSLAHSRWSSAQAGGRHTAGSSWHPHTGSSVLVCSRCAAE